MSGEMKCSGHQQWSVNILIFAFLLWIDWTALSLSPSPCLSRLLSTSMAPSIQGTAATILFVSENCLAQALSFPPLLLTADPLSFCSSKQLLKTLLTWFFKSSFTKHEVVRRRHQETNAVCTNNYQHYRVPLQRPSVLWEFVKNMKI